MPSGETQEFSCNWRKFLCLSTKVENKQLMASKHYTPTKNSRDLRRAGDELRASRRSFRDATFGLAPSKFNAKSGRRARKQDMREFWRVKFQYNPEVL